MNAILGANLVYVLIFMTGAFLVLFVCFIFLFIKFKKISSLSQQFFAGKNGKDLEEVVNSQLSLIQKNQKDIKELFDGYEKIFNIASKGIQKVGVVRYNPFRDMGGNQSFSIALMDMNNRGLVISTLATRDGTRVFSKPLLDGDCKDFPLIEEEKNAIKIAKASQKNTTI
jgi:hypothetical protein